jgi:death-on-curing protein
VILLDDILLLHKISIIVYGGSYGVRDLEGLKSAISRPFQTFATNDLYPTTIEKAAALGESLIVNHPFIDGNKRTGFTAMIALIKEDGLQLTANQVEAYNLTIGISTGEIKFDGIVLWLEKNSIKIQT